MTVEEKLAEEGAEWGIQTAKEFNYHDNEEYRKQEAQINWAREQLGALYVARNAAINAQLGEQIHCTNCGCEVTKRNYQTKFCSNQKTHGKRNCKDIFNNRVKGLKKTIYG